MKRTKRWGKRKEKVRKGVMGRKESCQGQRNNSHSSKQVRKRGKVGEEVGAGSALIKPAKPEFSNSE